MSQCRPSKTQSLVEDIIQPSLHRCSTCNMDTTSSNLLPNDRYQIGWVCALFIELAAALGMLDESHGIISDQDPQNTNSYHAGTIRGHNIIIACLPDGESGTNAAAVVATNMLRTFKNIKCCLLVGIGGGLPSDRTDIRLGDVVVSSAEGTSGGVIQFDLGKKAEKLDLADGQTSTEQFIRKGTLDRPPTALRTALSSLRAYHASGKNDMHKILQHVLETTEQDEEAFQGPTTLDDRLYLPSYVHSGLSQAAMGCSACDSSQVVERTARRRDGPYIFYGTILSGNVVVKNAKERDRLRDEFSTEKALCVEMQAAGLMNTLPCIVIRGICNYADSHKNDKWHGYAALTSAAFGKNLLFFVSRTSIENERPVNINKVSGMAQEPKLLPLDCYRLNVATGSRSHVVASVLSA